MPLNTLQTAAKVVPPDLVITSQPDVDKNYFDVTVSGLEVDTGYSFQFQWIWPDKTVGPWSAGYALFTATESIPGAPGVTVPSTAVGNIPVTLGTFPTNALRVDIKVTGGIFGIGKIAYSFLNAGTTTISAPAGVYLVEAYTVTPTQINGTPTAAFTITVTDVGEVIQNPVAPTGFSAVRTLGAIEVAWDGTYTGGAAWTGFNNINLYAGTSATATVGTYQKVGTFTANKTINKVNAPVDGTYVRYDNPVYFHASAVNKNGVESAISANVVNVPLGAGKATDADINNGAVVISKLASNVLFVDNLKAGTINSSSYIRSGNKTGARIEISGATTDITTETDPITGTVSTLTYPVKPGITIYGTNGTTELLRSDYSGNLSITGSGTFTGNLAIGTSPNIFKAEPATGIWLGGTDGTFANANFKVSTTGIMTALAGTVGGWTISSTQLTSGGTDYISLTPGTPRISIVKTSTPNAGTITLDPITGITVSGTGGTFGLTPNGNLTVTNGIFTGSINAGSSITGASFKTNTSGARVELSSTTRKDYIRLFDGNGAEGGIAVTTNDAGAGSGAMYFTSPAAFVSQIAIYGPNHATLANQISLVEGSATYFVRINSNGFEFLPYAGSQSIILANSSGVQVNSVTGSADNIPYVRNISYTTTTTSPAVTGYTGELILVREL
jgi:hypothetical protein